MRRPGLVSLVAAGAALWVGRWAARVLAAYAARHWTGAEQRGCAVDPLR